MLGFWNGLETNIKIGTGVVAPAPEFPAYWAEKEGIVGERIDVVWVNLIGVNSGGGSMFLDNRDGSGLRKVTEGMGSPMYGHKNLNIVEGTFQEVS